MNIFKRFFSSGTDESKTPSEALFVENIPTVPVAPPAPTKRDINWLFEFIDQDREQQGYEDAVANPDGNYRADFVKLFWSSLQLKIKMSQEHYDALLQEEEVQLDRCEKAGLLDTVAQVNKRMTHIREKVDQLNELAEKAQRQEGEAQRAVLSYSRGFNKGLAALTQAHVSRNPLATNHPSTPDLA